jgi:photosystem II stability/assembly factor-like uncharacterized protein
MTVTTLLAGLDGLIFAGTGSGGMFRSSDNGNSWQSANTGLTAVHILSLAQSTAGIVYAGSYDNGIFRSTDNGATWMAVSTGVPNGRIRAIAVNGNDAVFIGTAGNGIYRSTDSGDSWVNVNGESGIDDALVTSLAINDKGFVFAGTLGHSFFSSYDNGETWQFTNSGLNNIAISLIIDREDHIWAGTAGSGVFRSTVTSATDVPRIPDRSRALRLDPNFPNPVSGTTTIAYHLERRTFVSLQIYDIRGRQVMTIFEGMQSAGNHHLAVQLGGLPRGPYVYQLRTAEGIRARRMLLMH